MGYGPKGGNMSRKYEIAFLLRESEYVVAIERIKTALGKANTELVSENNTMGVRELAYVIVQNREKFTRGYYYFVDINAIPEQLVVFEEAIKYDQGIIRHMVVLDS
ncbi:MAG: 30S ribosomal protein S6 [Spirochaetota bacterium]|nr:30S ribosomal protein S6 [Spirochaetota bacterium]